MFESKFFSANTGSVIVVGKHIYLGHDVMMGRNIVIYDSDFHSIPGSDGNPVNYSKDVTIEDHVWLFVISINAFSFIASKTPKGNSIRVSYHASFIILLPNVIPM